MGWDVEDVTALPGDIPSGSQHAEAVGASGGDDRHSARPEALVDICTGLPDVEQPKHAVGRAHFVTGLADAAARIRRP
jgi:hypothetical protein